MLLALSLNSRLALTNLKIQVYLNSKFAHRKDYQHTRLSSSRDGCNYAIDKFSCFKIVHWFMQVLHPPVHSKVLVDIFNRVKDETMVRCDIRGFFIKGSLSGARS